MKIQVLFVPLLLMSITALLYVVFWKEAVASAVLLSVSYILLSISMLCKVALSEAENKKGGIHLWVHILSLLSVGLVLLSLWYHFATVLTR